MIRLILVALGIGSFLILSIPLMLIEWIIGKFNKNVRDVHSQKIVQWIFRVLLFLAGTTVEVYGEENLPKDRGVLFVGNHRSLFDVLIVYTKLKSLTGIVSKQEVGKIPLLSVWMRYINCYFLNRKDIKDGLKMVLSSIEKIKNGISIMIFPEGTRNKENDTFLPFKGGSFKIAEKSKCDIIPFAIVNAADIFEEHRPWVKKTTVILVFGEPIVTKDLDKEDLKSISDRARDEVIRLYESKKRNNTLEVRAGG